MILWYLNFPALNSSPMLVPKAEIKVVISLFAKTLSSLAFSTFKILPFNGKMACVFLSLPDFELPPAESPQQ